MPKDIRDFFSPSSKSKKAVASPIVEKKKVKNGRKRALVVDSDDDESETFKTPKKVKQKDTPKAKKSPNKGDETSKYFKEDKGTSKLFFGSQPVKQIKPIIEKPKKHSDVSLLDLDDDVFELDFSKLPEINKKQERVSVSPTKKSPKRSPSKSPSKRNFSPIKGCQPLNFGSIKKSPCDNKSPSKSPIKAKGDIEVKSPVKKNQEKGERPEKRKLSPAKKIELNNGIASKADDSKKAKKDLFFEEINEVPSVQTKKPLIESLKNRSAKCFEKSEKTHSTPKDPVKKVENFEKSELWVDKYRPTSLKNLIGLQGDKSVPKKLVNWLKNWEKNHSGNKKLTRPGNWVKDYDGAFFKAALLSGPPGVGKTTTAHLACKELNLDFVEYNASCTRSKRMLHDEITELLSSKSLSSYAKGGSSTSKSHVLIMDEVDGMAGNEDRGGVQELIALIKTTKVPVICMCNDRNHPKIRSLANYCFDLRVHRPRVEQIKGAMMSICFKEGLKINQNVLTEIINGTNQDIRLVLNSLSMLAAKKSASMDVSVKDLKIGAWDVVRKVFSEEENKKMSIHEKSDLFFNDYSIAPLFVQENYLQVVPHSKEAKSKKDKMKLFAKAADSLCRGDLVERSIRSQNAWSLLPTQAIFSSVIPGAALVGHMGGMINFPSWLGRNSKKGKMDRICQEIQVHSRLRTSGTKESIATDYGYALTNGIVKPLATLGSEGVESSLNVMREYMLLREDLDSLIEITTWPEQKNQFAEIEPKVKAAFTRAYNKCPVLTPCSLSGFKKVKNSSNDYEDEEDEIDEEESDDVNDDGMIIPKKKPKAAKVEAPKPEKEKKAKAPLKPRGGKTKKVK